MIVITEKRFRKICKWFSKHKITFDLMKICYMVLPVITAVSYTFLVISKLIYNDLFSEVFLKVLFVPAGVFIFVTLLREILNMPRPYEKYDIKPLMKKDTKGHSFPSRHTASVFIIAMTFLYAERWLGIVFLIFAFLISLTRFLAGVHFFRDILAGALISIICGIVFLFVL